MREPSPTDRSRLRRLTLAGVLALTTLPACGTVRLEVPEGHEVRLLREEESASVRSERVVWFWAFGGQPISDNSCKQEIVEHDLKEVRMHTYQGVIDNVFNSIGWIVTIVRRTLVVEGNP